MSSPDKPRNRAVAARIAFWLTLLLAVILFMATDAIIARIFQRPADQKESAGDPRPREEPTKGPDAPAPSDSDRSVINSIGMKLVQIPQGTFLMGSSREEGESGDDERPQHRVQISKPFHMGAYEVTQGEFSRVMETRPSFFSSTGPGKDRVAGLNTDRFPVEQVTWHNAVEFCPRLSRLPE